MIGLDTNQQELVENILQGKAMGGFGFTKIIAHSLEKGLERKVPAARTTNEGVVTLVQGEFLIWQESVEKQCEQVTKTFEQIFQV